MLEVYTLQDADKWDQIVTSFKDYDVYYLSGYSKGFKIHKDGEPLLFYYHDDNRKAINVVMKRDIHNDERFKNKIEPNKYFDFATPYGYGGWLIEGEGNNVQLMNEYSSWCKENNIISEVIRFHPILSNQDKVRDIYDVLDLGQTIAIDTTSEELIWSNFENSNRGKIKKAIKYGVTIEHKIDEPTIQEFKKIYNITMNKDDADDYYYFNDDFYYSIMNDLKGHSDIFYAIHEGKMVAATIILRANDKLIYHFSGVLTDYRYLQSTNLMLYEVALWGARNGYTSLHLGGGVGSQNDNLYIFKKAFNRKGDHQYSIGRITYDEEKYNYLLSLRDNIEKENFFPKYRG